MALGMDGIGATNLKKLLRPKYNSHLRKEKI